MGAEAEGIYGIVISDALVLVSRHRLCPMMVVYKM